ncbi:hypothetical protein I548_4915 [Mycobacterium intracellulare]|nr:hypothetical protein I548_4915 [Mycobacterium intracellulare]
MAASIAAKSPPSAINATAANSSDQPVNGHPSTWSLFPCGITRTQRRRPRCGSGD